MRPLNGAHFENIKAFVESHFAEKGSSPTIREIAIGTNIPYPTVQYYLNIMRNEGDIKYNGRRSIATPFTQKISNDETVLVGLVGSIACGEPMFAEENIEEYFRLPVALVGNGTFFLLRANGNSMIDAGIDKGDLVLIRQQNYADAGQIIVALVENETTLKRYYPDPIRKNIRLHPENKTMSDFYVTDLFIQGIAVKVLKDLI
jgi:repressor LexA